MRNVPAGVLYEPADTGFNNTLIAALGTVNGNVLAWCARARARTIVLFFEIVSGISVNFTLHGVTFDIDGQSAIVLSQSLWTVIAADAAAWSFDSTSRATSGTFAAAAVPVLFGAPYLRLDVENVDAVNAGNVTVRVLLKD